MNPVIVLITAMTAAWLGVFALYEKISATYYPKPKIYTHICINGVSYLESNHSLTPMYNPDGLPEPCEGTND